MLIKCKFYLTMVASLILSVGVNTVYASDLIKCSAESKKTGQDYKVKGEGVIVRKGPGKSYEKIINQKATAALKKTHYITVDFSSPVHEECTQSGWSFIRVTEPESFRNTHAGWVQSSVLLKKKVDSAGVKVITESDVIWDKDTKPYKSIIVEGLNKIHRENANCKEIDSMVIKSKTKSTKVNPVFFVTCGSGAKAVNVFFSKSDLKSGKQLLAARNIDKGKAFELCKAGVLAKATHPSTVQFPSSLGANITEHPNGRTRVVFNFTAKNSFNLELKHKANCILEESGLIETNISETQ